MIRISERFRAFLLMTLPLCGAFALTPGLARGADHRDGPRFNGTGPDIRVFGNLDLNDLFMFVSPTNRENSVLILSLGGAGAGFVTPAFFSPGSLYEFRIDNNGDNIDDLALTFIFSNPDRSLRQTYRAFYVPTNGRARLLAQGVTGRNTTIKGGGMVTAGLFDDPFFFDSAAFSIFTRLVAINAPLGERVAPFTGTPFPDSTERDIRTPRPPNNFFANTNILGIAIELPRIQLQSNRNNPVIRVWCRDTLNDGVTQFDRVAIPGVGTSTLPPGEAQDMFNSSTPLDDIGFRPIVAQRVQVAYGVSAAAGEAIANALLPDRLPFNTTKRTGFNEGLNLTLNGRRLTDDVIDAELGLLTQGALTSDRVVNDSLFRKNFPYIGAALPVRVILGQ